MGTSGTSASYSGAIRHNAGGSWAKVSSPTKEALTAVWGASASQIWITGYAGTVLTYKP